MNSEEILHAQRRLRSRLLDDRQAAIMPGSSDLAAHLLLYLDDAERCWQLTLEWLRHTLDADRVDGGFVRPALQLYRPAAESVRSGLRMPSSVDVAIDVGDGSVRTVLASPTVVVFQSVQADLRFTPLLRSQLLSLGTSAKLGMSLHDGRRPIALVCCDWRRERPRWSADQCRDVSAVASGVLSPIFSTLFHAVEESEGIGSAARSAAVAPTAENRTPAGAILPRLTPGELQVARLVATGMSYKEIANRLNRSFSTVDHRLRSIRDKLGARSTARMVVLLSELFSGRRHG